MRLGESGLDKDTRRPNTRREQRGRDIRSFATAFATVKSRCNRRIQCDRGGIVAATRYRPGRRRAGVACHREQTASRPIGREIKSAKSGVGTFLALAADIRIDQPRLPFRYAFILQPQLLSPPTPTL